MNDSKASPERDAPDGWVNLGDPDETQMLNEWQCRRNGLVLMLERATTRDRFAVSALPENWRDDNQPIRFVGDGGYLYSGDSRDDAEAAAVEWMREHPRGEF